MTTVKYYGWDAAVREVGAQWRQVIRDRSFNPSLHPDWLGATLGAWGLTNSARVAVIRQGADTFTVVPFLLRDHSLFGVRFRAADLCSNVVSYHNQIVSTSDVADALSALLTDDLFPPWDVFRLGQVLAGSPTALAVRHLDRQVIAGLSTRPGESSPYLRVTGTWQEYLATRPKKLRANFSRSQRLMRDAGETGITWYGADSDWQQLLREMLEVERQSWKATAGVAIDSGSAQSDYYERLLPWLTTSGLMANVLFVKDRPVAYTLCASWQGWVGQLKTSYVEGLGDAGSRVIHCSIERAFGDHQAEYDFLGDTAPHKMRWAHDVRAHEDLWLFGPHTKGKALRLMKGATDRWHARQRAKSESPVNVPLE